MFICLSQYNIPPRPGSVVVLPESFLIGVIYIPKYLTIPPREENPFAKHPTQSSTFQTHGFI